MLAPEIRQVEIMAISQMEGSGLGSARFTKMAVSFLIAFFLLYMLSLVYRSSTFDLIGGFSRAIGTGEMAGNDTGASGTDKSTANSLLFKTFIFCSSQNTEPENLNLPGL